MNRLKSIMKDRFVHLYAWLLGVPGTFLVMIFAFYIGGRSESFGDAWREVFSNSAIMAFLIPWSIFCGYVEAWYVQKKARERSGGAGGGGQALHLQ